MDQVELLQRKLEREKKARNQAESILEKKTLELYSANKRLEELNSNKDDLLKGVSTALTTIFQYGELDEALQKSVDKLGPNTKADRAVIFLFDDNKRMRIGKYFEWSETPQRNLFEVFTEDEKLLKEFIANTRYYLDGTDDFYEIDYKNERVFERKLIDEIGVKSGIYFPIIASTEIIGFFGVDIYSEMKSWSDNERSLLRAFAAGIGSSIEKKSTRIAIERQKQFYESVLNSIPSDLVVFDTNHTYKFINPQAISDEEMREWLIDKDDYDYVNYRNKDISIADKRRKAFNKVIENKEASSFEEKSINSKGDVEWKHRIMYPVMSDDGSEVSMVIGYAVDVTNIKKTQEEIEIASERLETLISSLNSGVLLEDKDRKILVTNNEFCEIFGIPANPDDLVGVDCSDSAQQSKHLAEDPEEFVKRIDKLLVDKKIVTNEEIKMKDGRVFERDFIPIYLNDNYLGHLWEYRDVTLRKESEASLIRAREEAEESKRMKQKFLANMSHEIRTPMNGVVGIVHLLERTDLDQNQKKYLGILKDSSEHLLHIINDILDVSKMEEGKLVLINSPVQIDSVIEGVIQNLKGRLRDRKLRLEVSGMEIFDSHLLTDAVRIRQILLNLLSNAIKFTKQGKVGISCHSLEENEKHHKFRIEVSDTGIGIPKDKRDKIFDAFDQGSIDTASQFGGTGLGLNIVKELVDKLNGTIDVESKPGEGSKFSITLDLEKVENEDSYLDESKFEVQSRINSLKGKTILVADDHEINFSIAKEFISDWGCDVLYAEDGEKAIQVLIENEVDLILMDMQMPNVNGIEATEMIRLLDDSNSKVPIIAMTAAALPEERERCLSSGMNDYISKPYNPSLLYDLISKHLSAPLKSTNPGNENRDGFTDTGFNYDLTYLKDLSGNSAKFIYDMINSFISDMPEFLELMSFNANRKEFDKLAAVAHKSKSLAIYLGCKELRQILIEIEEQALTVKDQEKIQRILTDAHTLTDTIIAELKEVKL